MEVRTTMDLGIITELITNLGLPIALVIAMAWFIYKIYKKSEEREETLMEEIKENRKINAQAIETIALYAERLTHIEDNVAEIKDDVILIKQKL
jgi:preprotein translocase subunit YajC